MDVRGSKSADAPAIAPGVLPLAGFLLAALALWTTQHPYVSLEHDSRIYLMLSLGWLHPDQFANDLLVAFGSQGDFTIFPAIAGQLMRLSGNPLTGLFFAWLACFALFVAGLWAFVRSLLHGPWHWIAFGVVLVVASDYGIEGVLSYGEAVATPRPGAEGLTLLAIACWLGTRHVLALVSLAFAFMLHPLVAMPGAVIIALLAVPERWIWLIVCLSTAAMTGIFVASSPDAPALLAAMDPAWLDTVRARAPYLFPDVWSLSDWGRAMLPVLWLQLLLMAMGESGRLAQVARAALITAVIGLVASVCTSLVPNVLFIQGQPWRWIWPAKLVAVAVAPWLLAALWQSGSAGRTSALLAVSGWLTQDVGGPILVLIAALLWSVRRAMSPDFWRAAHGIGAACAVASLAWAVTRVAVTAGAGAGYLTESTLAAWVASLSIQGLLPALLLVLIWRYVFIVVSPARSLVLAAIALAAAVPTAVTWKRAISPPLDLAEVSTFLARVESDSVVYWPDHPVETWLALQRASYVSQVQSTASLFSREAAVELARRARSVEPLYNGASILDWSNGPMTARSPSHGDIIAICRDDRLDFMVIRRSNVDQGPLRSQLGSSLVAEAGPYLLVDCRHVRAPAGAKT